MFRLQSLRHLYTLQLENSNRTYTKKAKQAGLSYKKLGGTQINTRPQTRTRIIDENQQHIQQIEVLEKFLKVIS